MTTTQSTLAAALAAVVGFFTGRTAHRREVERHQVAMQMRRIQSR